MFTLELHEFQKQDESVELLNCFQGQSQDCLEAQGWNKGYLNSSISKAKGQTDELTIFFFLS